MSDDVDPDMASGLLSMSEQMQPMIEAADGFKASMKTRGWSDQSAESAASCYLNGLVNLMFATAVANA